MPVEFKFKPGDIVKIRLNNFQDLGDVTDIQIAQERNWYELNMRKYYPEDMLILVCREKDRLDREVE